MASPRAALIALRSEARAYEHGEGVARDPGRAVALYCEAARLGDAEAQFSLGWMYANGRGIAARQPHGVVVLRARRRAGSRVREEDARVRRRPGSVCPNACATERRRRDAAASDRARRSLRACRRSRRRPRTSSASSRPRYAVSPRLRARHHSRRIQLRPERALAQERAGPDAAHPRDVGAVQRQEAVRPRARTFAAGSRTCAGCSPTSGATSRWSPPPTTPAKAPVERYRGVPPYAETRATCSGSSRCSAASAIRTMRPGRFAAPFARHGARKDLCRCRQDTTAVGAWAARRVRHAPIPGTRWRSCWRCSRATRRWPTTP